MNALKTYSMSFLMSLRFIISFDLDCNLQIYSFLSEIPRIQADGQAAGSLSEDSPYPYRSPAVTVRKAVSERIDPDKLRRMDDASVSDIQRHVRDGRRLGCR